jgi:hypothetical protein
MRRTFVLAAACAVTLATVGVAGEPAQAAPSAPGRVRAVHAVDVTAHGLRLTWKNPGKRHFVRSEVRMLSGTHAPTSSHRGRHVAYVPARRHGLTVHGLKSAHTYSFAVFANDGHGHRAKPTTVRVTTRLDAPTLPRVYDGGTSTVVSWRNPSAPAHALRRVVVRYARGAAAPTSPARGTGARLGKPLATQAVLTSLGSESAYAVSVFAIDRAGRASAPAVVRFVSTPRGPGSSAKPGRYAGTVVDTDGAPLIGADVVAFNYSATSSGAITTRTGADGTFDLSLPPGQWDVGADGSRAVGGNSDRTGYVSAYADVTVASGSRRCPAPGSC